VPTLKAEGSSEKPSPGGFLRSFKSTFRVIFPVWMVCVCRDTAVEGIRFFLPLLIASRGGSLVNIGTVLFLIGIMGAISPMFGGPLADRFGKRRVIEIGMAAAPLFFVPAALISGPASIVLYMAGDALLHGILPVTGAAAQEMVPGARSTAASMVTGLSFGLAGLLLAPIGALADIFGLTWVLVFVGLLPLFPMPIFWTMWKEQKQGDMHQEAG
jgi:FSR family fosmidomycin resistance protein-like MFS transporter